MRTNTEQRQNSVERQAAEYAENRRQVKLAAPYRAGVYAIFGFTDLLPVDETAQYRLFAGMMDSANGYGDRLAAKYQSGIDANQTAYDDAVWDSDEILENAASYVDGIHSVVEIWNRCIPCVVVNWPDYANDARQLYWNSIDERHAELSIRYLSGRAATILAWFTI